MGPFHYIIVGAGSAGCVLAERLSRVPQNHILVIESGPSDDDMFINMPRGFGKTLMNPRLTHVYPVQKSGGYNEPEYWIRGKVVGGSSSLNGMVYVRGQPSDYDDWNCDGWRWNDIKPYFLAQENHELGASELRGAGGPLNITIHPTREPILEAVVASARDLGIPTVEDLNAIDGEGFGYQPRNIWKGQRQSAAKIFLKPALKRGNIHLMTESQVLHLLHSGKQITGVRVQTGDHVQDILGSEVILTAGAINTPTILQRSGIGPAQHLQSVGINILHDSPDVGQNMREHRLLNNQYRLRSGSNNFAFQGMGLIASALRYFLFKSGPLTSAAFEVGGFIRTEPGRGRPDAQLGIGPMSIDRSTPGLSLHNFHGALCGGYVMRPESQGSVLVNSMDAKQPPMIDPNYLATDYDRRVSVALFRFARRLFAQAPLAPYVEDELDPGLHIDSDDEIIDAFHRIGGSGYHAAGTCRMGMDEHSVVDTKLRVRGVGGLRVADISIMPSLVSGNTNAPAMAMAARAGDLILSAS